MTLLFLLLPYQLAGLRWRLASKSMELRCKVTAAQVRDLEVSGLFFAIGHEPATKFLDGQLKLDGEVSTHRLASASVKTGSRVL